MPEQRGAEAEMMAIRGAKRRSRVVLAAVAAAIGLSACAGPGSNGDVVSPLSGARGAFYPGLAPSPHWMQVVARHSEAMQSPAPVPGEWVRLVAKLRGLDLKSKVEAANAEINRRPYVRSEQNWGRPDYWATPFEFLAKNGQCQDYAVAKYFLLRASGVPVEQLRIVVMQDLEAGVAHAAVIAEVDGETLLLDNQMPTAVSAAMVRRYRPIYALNENGWWLFETALGNFTFVAGLSRG